MKKIILALLLLNFYIYGDSTEVFLEYNLDKNIELNNSLILEKENRDFGLNMEFYSPPKGNLLGGFGIINNRIKLSSAEKLNLTTYYLVNKYYFGKTKIKTYGKLQLGGYYPSTVFEKTNITKPQIIQFENGLYYGVSLGLEYEEFMLQSSYRTYLGDVNISSSKSKLDYNTITISLGYNIMIK